MNRSMQVLLILVVGLFVTGCIRIRFRLLDSPSETRPTVDVALASTATPHEVATVNATAVEHAVAATLTVLHRAQPVSTPSATATVPVAPIPTPTVEFTPTTITLTPTSTSRPTATPTSTPIPSVTSTWTPTPSRTPRPTSTSSGRTHFDNGVILIGQTKYQQAIEQFDLALSMGFETAELYHNRGWACHEWQYYEKQCSYEQAIADYDKAIELEPNTPDYYRDRAWSYRHLGEADLAITDYSKTIAINPKDVHAWHGRGLSQMDKAEYTEAIDDISQAISLTPDGFVLYWDRGNAYRYLGQIEDARADYETFLELTKGQSYPDWASQRNEAKKWLDDTSETIQIRLRIVSSSDWTTVHLVSSNVIIFQRTVEQEGTLDIVDLNGPILHMNQTLARAEQGQTFELTQDITLHKQPDQKELKLIIEVGCIGETTVEPFLIGRYTLVSLGQITTNNCNLPGETYSVDLDAS